MKKTLLLLLIPFLNFAQGPWNFNNTDEGWTTSAAIPSVGANAITLTTNGGTNPAFGTLSANVDATTNKFAAVTLKVGAGGPTYLRVSFPNSTGGRVYKPVVITNGDVAFKTYYIDLTNPNWTGTVNDVKLHFKNNDGSTAGVDHISTGVTIEIDKVEIVQYPEKYIYEFNTNGDSESWTGVDATATVSSGNITVTPSPGLSSKITQDVFAVNATNHGYMHITYKNTSTLNNQVRIQFRSSLDGFVAYKGKNITINQNMTGFETLHIDLTTIPEWTTIAKNLQIAMRDTNNANLASAGDFIIDRIVIDNDGSLAVKDIIEQNNISIYPNPTSSILNILSEDKAVDKIEVFAVNGQKVIELCSQELQKLDVTELPSGIYFLNLYCQNVKIKTHKFIKN